MPKGYFFLYADCDNQWQFLRLLRLILAYICLWQQPENWLACPNPTALVLCEVNFCSCTCFMRLRSGDSPCLLNAARALWSWMEETEGVNYGRRDLAVDYQCDGRQMDCRGEECSVIIRVRKCNWGWHFSPFKCCVSQLSVDRFGNNFWGLITLGQVKSSPNFCSFGPQRAEERNIWRGKNTKLNLNSGLCL